MKDQLRNHFKLVNQIFLLALDKLIDLDKHDKLKQSLTVDKA